MRWDRASSSARTPLAASPPRKTILAAIRRRLRAHLKEMGGGAYVKGTRFTSAFVHGVTVDGIDWRVDYGVPRASNGEVAAVPRYTLKDASRLSRCVSGLGTTLPKAIDAFRAECDGTLVYVVANNAAPGRRVRASPLDGLPTYTEDLGLARWTQLQASNRPDLMACRLEGGSAVMLREIPFTSQEGLDALDVFEKARGVSSWDAVLAPREMHIHG